MKRNIFLPILLCAIILLPSCIKNGEPVVLPHSEEEMDLSAIAENYPKIDGSTSALPIIQEIYKKIHPFEFINGDKVGTGLPQSVSQTIFSYLLLISGDVDMIIVPDPSEEVKSIADAKGVELEYVPICLEALVFIVNSTTDVDTITTKQIKSIYTDLQINNWSQLGGKDIEIDPLVRNSDSGSHALMEKFVLQGEQIDEELEEHNVMRSMYIAIERVESYVSGDSYISELYEGMPIGYTLYYFLQNNKESQKWHNVKMLNIDGIEPNEQTIASGEYPYSTNYFAVIKKDEPQNSPSRKLISWLLSPEGQQILSNAGFGVIK